MAIFLVRSVEQGMYLFSESYIGVAQGCMVQLFAPILGLIDFLSQCIYYR
jgi:hypothetical protein